MSIIAVDITDQDLTLPIGPTAPGSPVWVPVRPNLRRAHAVGTDILAALGKRRDLAGKGRNEHQDLQLAAAWLRAYDTTDLILVDAQHLGSKILGTICRLAADAVVDLWLLHRAPTSEVFIRALKRRSDVEKLLADVPPPVLRSTVAHAMDPFPTVPRHDMHLFRHAVEQTLTSADQARVLARFDRTAREAYDQITDGGPTAVTIARLVDDILIDAPGDAELITQIRGVQLAAWHHDAFLRVDLTTLLNSEERPTLPAAAIDHALVAYRQPHRIITCALTAHGYSLDHIASISRDDVLDDGRLLQIHGSTMVTPDIVARALRVACETTEPDEEGNLLLPYALQTLAAVLTDASKDLGVHVKGRRAERTRPGHIAYLKRLGLSIRTLP